MNVLTPWRDRRTPHEVQVALERGLLALFTARMECGQLRLVAMAPGGVTFHDHAAAVFNAVAPTHCNWRNQHPCVVALTGASNRASLERSAVPSFRKIS